MVVMTNTAFVGLKQGTVSDRFFLLHELGHYYCGHLAQPPKLEDEFAKRKTAMGKGVVPKEEREADSFAAQYLGTERAIAALQEAMEERMAYDLMCGTICRSNQRTGAMRVSTADRRHLCGCTGHLSTIRLLAEKKLLRVCIYNVKVL